MTTKEKVLIALLQAKDAYCSGDQLAQSLAISRESVHKAVTALRQSGLTIQAQKGQGYRYVKSGKLDALVIRYYLSGTVLGNLTVQQEVTSTQDAAKNWLNSSHANLPGVFIANRQTQGYGRRRRVFYSPAESGLYLSVALPNPQNSFENVGLLTTGVATAILKVLQQFYPDKHFGLKWVNDILLDERKVAGILCEAALELESTSSSAFIIGVGLDLATADYPEDVAPVAGSIAQDPGERNALAAAVIQAILHAAKTYQTGDFLPAYRKASVLLNRQVTLNLGGTSKASGQVVGIADNGGLILATARGRQVYTSGEVVKVNWR